MAAILQKRVKNVLHDVYLMLSANELDTRQRLRSRLQSIDTDIRTHEQALHALYLVRTQVQEQIEALRYPVVTLPFEITSKIFIDCLPDDAPAYPVLDDAPLVFTRVCTNWRDVALNTSALWTHLRLELDSDDNPGYIDEKWVAMMHTWIKRAGSQPLTLAVLNKSYTDPDKSLLGVLNAYIPHCCAIELKLPFAYFSRLSQHASLPRLGRLTLSAHGSPDIIHPISVFLNAPILHHVSLEGGMHASEVILPYDQLSSLEFYSASSDDVLELLSLTGPALTSCLLDVHYTSHTLTSTPPLNSLQTYAFSGPAAWGLLRYISMPALRSLDLTRASPPSAQNIPQLLGFLQRSQCTLEELRVYVRSNITAQFLQLLRRLPSLCEMELVIAEADVGTSIFRELALRVGLLLPNLETLSVRCMEGDSDHLQILLRTIPHALRARPLSLSANSKRISSIVVSLEGTEDAPPRPAVLQRFRELAADTGMRVSVRSLRERWV
ncbi:hypothetical protein C8F01DRAFT_1322809 [Mycena amicta]|nr:hypothetical protein C8F01DRAFT_1322809 [Mycena amicta]